MGAEPGSLDRGELDALGAEPDGPTAGTGRKAKTTSFVLWGQWQYLTTSSSAFAGIAAYPTRGGQPRSPSCVGYLGLLEPSEKEKPPSLATAALLSLCGQAFEL